MFQKYLGKNGFGKIGTLEEGYGFSSTDLAVTVQIGAAEIGVEWIGAVGGRHYVISTEEREIVGSTDHDPITQLKWIHILSKPVLVEKAARDGNNEKIGKLKNE